MSSVAIKAHKPMFPKSIAAMGNLGVPAAYESAVHFPREGAKAVPQLLGGVFSYYMAVFIFNLISEVEYNQSVPQSIQRCGDGRMG